MRRYLFAFAAFLLLLCMIGSFIIAMRYWNYWESDGYGLVRYQRAKLSQLHRVDTVFIGDSTLGNAIEVSEFDRLTGSHSVKLALTGLYGYAGTLHFAERVFDRAPHIKRMVIMQSPDMMLRGTEYDGAFFTLYQRWPAYLPWHMQWGLLQTASSRLTEYAMVTDTARRFRWRLTAGRGWPRWTSPIDYIQQGPAITVSPLTLNAGGINPDKFVFLNRLGQLCAAKGVDCVYVHGPLSQNILELSGDYFDKGNQAIRSSGLTLPCPLPLAMQPEQNGDAYDHMHPSMRLASTAYYADILTAYWNGTPPACARPLTP